MSMRIEGSILLLLLCLTGGGLSQSGDVQEYCNMEKFEGKCGDSEVIRMEMAHYGRMRIGRCVEKNYGNLGCKTDVLSEMDSRCSGRAACTVSLPDDSLYQRSACPKGVTSYLEAAYTCLPVARLGRSECRARSSPHVLSASSGYLAPGAFHDVCDVIIRVPAGQRVNITLYDFGTAAPSSPGRCTRYATLREEQTAKEDVVCSGGRRVRNVFLSAGREVKVTLMPLSQHADAPYYALHYRAVGCPAPRLSTNAHLAIKGDRAVVTCNATGEKWNLVCSESGRWVGDEVGRCAQPQVQESGGGIWTVLTHEWTTPYGILIVIGLGVGLGVVIGVLLLVAVLFCMKRQERHLHAPPADMHLEGAPAPDSCTLTATLRKTYCPLPVTAPHSYDDVDAGLYTRRQKEGGGDATVPRATTRGTRNAAHVYETPK